ncbi:MAG: hypothetical protein ACXACP_13590 [Candidatus Hodarchaeales archaeon]|jgi:hypothetical protein
MKVKELRALLKGLPPNSEVFLANKKGPLIVEKVTEGYKFYNHYGEMYDEKECAAEELKYRENCIVLFTKDTK